MLLYNHAGVVPDQRVVEARVPFAQMRDAFALAMQQSGGATLEKQYRIAGYPVRVRVVGHRLARQVGAALAHLNTSESDTGALTIDLWDQRATGVTCDLNATHPTNDVLIMMKATTDGRFVCEQRYQGQHWLDRADHRIIGSTQAAGQRHLDERARPFHKLLATWLNDRGIQFIHSGLIEIAGRGVLFAGHGGVGKSTTSLACLQAGHRYLGDDFIGIERTADGSFTGYGLYSSGLLCVDHLQRFPDLTAYTHPPYHPHEHKAVFYVNERFPGAMCHKTKIGAIALPRVVDREFTSYRPAARSEALLALAPTSVMLLPVPSARAFETLAQLVEAVPVYWLELGRDIEQIPDAVRDLADELPV